jgi:hypothetical protein
MRWRRYWLWLVPVAILVAAVDILVLSSRRGSVPRPATPVVPATLVMTDVHARHVQPDIADYDAIISMRNGLALQARSLARAISQCERGVHDPYGAGLSRLGACMMTPLHVMFESSRFGPAMFTGILEDLEPGACMQLASGVMEGISQLGGASYQWIGDIQTPGASSSSLNRGDAAGLRQIIASVVSLASSSAWRTGCRPRPYDPSEHAGAVKPAPQSRPASANRGRSKRVITA